MVQSHKHLPEMVKECGLQFAPVFNPIICDFYCGMCVSVGLHTRLMNKKYGANDVRKALNDYYGEQNFVKVIDEEDTPSFLAANKLAGTNELHIYVTGNEDRILLSSVFDNLGKGASGAAVQNMNIMLGLDETISLV
jgi:N-acetyl-gamma-glutamyl-phosphate reductase